jgi:hypothetical protein
MAHDAFSLLHSDDAIRFPGDMAGLAFSAVLQPYFSGQRPPGYHETDIIERCGVQNISQIEGVPDVLVHHIRNQRVTHKCYPIDWNYSSSATLWFNMLQQTTHSSRYDACQGCAPVKGQNDFRGCRLSKKHCELWGCTCQGFSNAFGTSPGKWARAKSSLSARDWWLDRECLTSSTVGSATLSIGA